MKTPSQKAFIITLSLYALALLIGYWLYTQDTPPTKENNVKLTTVPVTLAMFQAPPIAEPTPPVQTEEAVIEPKVEPVINPLPEPKIKPTIEPKIKPKPIQTPPPKTVKPQTTQPIEPKKLLPPPKELPKEQPKKPPVKQSPIPPQPNIVAEPMPPATPTPPKVQTPTVAEKPYPQPPQLSHPNTEQAEKTYLSELNHQIAQHAKNSYPKRAKRRRWEGEVLIQFTLFPNGAIKHLSIIQSSGRSMLDEAAIHILKTDMNSQFKPFPDDIVRNKWVIKVPVSYHLEY